MLEKWLEALEKEKQDAIDQLRSLPADPNTIKTAIREIEVNCATAKNYLKQMDEEGYRLNDDLSCIQEEYLASADYRGFSNHISNHLWRIQKMPGKIKDGTFNPEFSPYY